MRINMHLFVVGNSFVALTLCLVNYVTLVLAESPSQFSASSNDVGKVMSPGFPSSCCSSYSFTIETVSDEQPGYIRMTFSDLDLPKGSKLQIYDGTTASAGNLFKEQPEIRRGMWTKPYVSSSEPGGAIHVKFTPPTYANGTAKVYNDYVGFKASYWVTNSPPDHWDDKALEGACTPIVSSETGLEVKQKTIDYPKYHGATIDCVWQLKVPEIGVEAKLNQTSLKAYLRIDDLNFKGYLDIREGISSAGRRLLTVDTFETPATSTTIQQPTEGFSSSEGLYIHLTMLNEGRGVVKFVYGLLHKQTDLLDYDEDDPRSCFFGSWQEGFKCVVGGDSWCIPPHHACNGVNNCPNGDDENEKLTSLCLRNEPDTTPPTTTTTTTTTTPRPTLPYALPSSGCNPVGSNVMCTDYTCQNKYTYCRGHGDTICKRYNQVWCPRQGCISGTKYGYYCEKYCGKCSDNTCRLDGKCPGVCNTSYRKKCKDGSCINKHSTCPGECQSYEKKCRNGNCISSSSMCPEDPCYFSHYKKCDNRIACYATYETCDGTNDCSDGTDEKNCGDKTWWKWLFIIPAVLVVVIVICIKCSGKSSENTQGNTEYASVAGNDINSHAPNFTGTRLQATTHHSPSSSPVPAHRRGVAGHSSPRSGPSHSYEYDLDPGRAGRQERPTAPEPEPATIASAPPAYDVVMENSDTYVRPEGDGQTLPPSYDSVHPNGV